MGTSGSLFLQAPQICQNENLKMPFVCLLLNFYRIHDKSRFAYHGLKKLLSTTKPRKCFQIGLSCVCKLLETKHKVARRLLQEMTYEVPVLVHTPVKNSHNCHQLPPSRSRCVAEAHFTQLRNENGANSVSLFLETLRLASRTWLAHARS